MWNDRGRSFYIKGGEEGKDRKRLWCSKIIQKMAILVVGRHHILHISHFMRKKSEKYRLWGNPSSWEILKQIQKFAGQIRVYSVFKYHFATNFLHGIVKLPGGNCTQWTLKVRWSSGLHLFLAGQAHCICIQVLRSSPVIHLCGGLAHHELPYLALTEAKGKWLFPALWIIVKQCY